MNDHHDHHDHHRSKNDWIAWILATYDHYVATNPTDGAPISESRDAVAHAYAAAVTEGAPRWQVDLETEGKALFTQAVDPTRDQRRRNLTRDGKYLLAALLDETILGDADPILDLAFPLGDGRDKTLRYWTRDDWESARTSRYRNAADVAKAAAEFDMTVATEFIKALAGQNARMTGDLFT